MSGQVRPRARARVCASLEDYEAHGKAFYRLAAEHEMAEAQGLDRVLEALSERCILTEKALGLVAGRCLGPLKNRLSEL